ncbi:MAG: 30S ribosomal protein S8 [Phycisphaerae bacterium SM23_33]|jgi:small subunit ribosomal protein S8|nr:MAG: 30S ribosomal protein S8 [Phycisphaerae bacterium SM23_33]
MGLSDPIADMLTRIRNAARNRRESVNVRASGVCEGIAKVLQQEGYIQDCKRLEDGKQGLLRIYLRYSPSGEQVIMELKRVSRPGRRVYSGVEDLPRPLDGLGVAIVSTSRGVLSDRQCRRQRLGGEVLCTVC